MRAAALTLATWALATASLAQLPPAPAFLCHFAQLVTWPEPAGSESPPLIIAVVGPDPFGEGLEAAIHDQTAPGRKVLVRRVASIDELPHSLHILFFGSVEPAELERGLALVARTPVLTVSAIRGFARQGGMIGFRRTRDRRVTFDINARAASAAGLKISSQLLKLGRIVETRK